MSGYYNKELDIESVEEQIAECKTAEDFDFAISGLMFYLIERMDEICSNNIYISGGVKPNNAAIAFMILYLITTRMVDELDKDNSLRMYDFEDNNKNEEYTKLIKDVIYNSLLDYVNVIFKKDENSQDIFYKHFMLYINLICRKKEPQMTWINNPRLMDSYSIVFTMLDIWADLIMNPECIDGYDETFKNDISFDGITIDIEREQEKLDSFVKILGEIPLLAKWTESLLKN